MVAPAATSSDGDLGDLIRWVEPHLRVVGRAGGATLLRYDEPTGARLHLVAGQPLGSAPRTKASTFAAGISHGRSSSDPLVR